MDIKGSFEFVKEALMYPFVDIILVLVILSCLWFLFVWVGEKARLLAKGKQKAPQTVIKIEQTLPDDAVIDGGEI